MLFEELEQTNLDALSLDELEEIEAKYLKLADTIGSLAEYARRKGEAMRARQRGEIVFAFNLERYLESLYQLLPKEVRW